MSGLAGGMQGLSLGPGEPGASAWQSFPIPPGAASLFAEADADADGQVGRGDAKAFFVRTGIPGPILAKIWARCHFSAGEGLTPPEFAMALRLCALAQSGHEFSSENVERTLEPGRAIRLPSLTPPLTLPGSAAPPPAPVPPPPPPKRSSFTALGGEAGPPSRGATEADAPCPPGIELRPVPLRPRTSSRLRVLVATSSGALWAGPSLRGGVLRYPDVSTAAHLGMPLTGIDSSMVDPSSAAVLAAPPPGATADVVAPAAQGEDADAEPCGEFTGPPSVAAANAAAVSSGGVTCACFEPGRDIIWTGHSDGRVCSWRSGVAPRGQPPGLGGGCVASWQAHKGPMAAMVLTRDGSLWSGGKGGTLRVWHPGITLAGPPTSMAPTSAAAALAGALSGPSLADGAKTLTRRDGNKPHLELRGLAACMHGTRELVWSAGATSFVVWCAKTYVALRVITPDGSPVPDIPPEEAAEQQRAKEAASGGGGAASLFGRLSKAVERRVARANEYLDGADVGTSAGGPRILALAAAPWGGLIASLEVQAQSGGGNAAPAGSSSSGNLAGASGSTHGGGTGDVASGGPTYLVQRYASDGSPADNATAVGAPVRTLVAAQPPAGVAGPLLMWVGLANGTVLVLEAEAAGGAGSHVAVRATWAAHKGSLVSCAPVPGRMLTLGDDGAIRAWPWNGAVATPGAGAALERLIGAISTTVQLRIFTGTWNVAEKRPDPRSLRAWLGDRVDGCDVVALGLQEIEKLNASSVGASAAKELVGLGDVMNANATWWQTSMLAALEEATATSGGGPWECLAGRQLSGALVLVYVRRRLAAALGAPLTASAACGIMGVGGNKGGVGVRVSLHRKALVFVNCHLAAHQNAVRKRNDNVATIFTNLMFEPQLAEFWRLQQQRSAGQTAAPSASAASTAAANDDDSGDDAPNNDDLPSAAAADAKAAAAGAKKVALPPAGGMGDADLLMFFGDTNYRLDVTYDDAIAAAARGDTAWLARHDQCSKERSVGRVFQEPRLQEGPLGFLPTYKFDKGTSVYDTSEKKRIPAWCDRVLWADNPGKGVQSELLAYESVMDVCESDHKPVRQLLRVTLHTCDEPRRRRAVVAALHMQGAGVQAPPLVVVQPLVQDLLSL